MNQAGRHSRPNCLLPEEANRTGVGLCHKGVKCVRDRVDRVRAPVKVEVAEAERVPVETASARAAAQKHPISPELPV
jgi:hypothetical protein